MATSENVIELSEEDKEKITQWISSSKSVRILVTGKTGVGKSTLVNALVGEYVAKEGDTLDPETQHVERNSLKMSGVDVTFWDTPGLQDGTRREGVYLKEMSEQCKDVDLVVYCARMDEARFREEDYEAIKNLTKAFGPELWTNVVVVLTFANMVRPMRVRNDPEKVREFFLSRLLQWEKKIREVVGNSGVEPETAGNLPVIPAGYEDDPSLPDREDWLGTFWFECLKRMKGRAQPAMLKINAERLKPQTQSEKDSDQPLHRKPITAPDLDIEDMDVATASMVGGFVLGSVLGAPLGPVGMAVGAATGMATGTTISIIRALKKDSSITTDRIL